MMRRSIGFVAAMAVLAGATTGFAVPSLVSVGVADPTTPHSTVRGLSPDGSYATGASTSKQYAHLPAAENPYFWSSTGGLVQIANPSGTNSQGRGIAIRPNAGEVILAGSVGGILRVYRAPLADPAAPGNAGWKNMAQLGVATDGTKFVPGTSQALRLDNTGSFTDERWYVGGQKTDSGRTFRLRGDSIQSGNQYISWDGSGGKFESISGTGVGVATTLGLAMWESPSGDDGLILGGNNLGSSGFGISADGNWFSGFDKYTSSNYEAFRYNRGDSSMQLLGRLDPANNHLSVAYAIANNGVAGGGSYGTAGWTATVWDTSGTWDTSGQPQSVQALLDAAGIDTSMWTKLERVFATSDDGTVIAGDGIWAADGSTRGFIATIPEPATALFLALGGLALLRRQH